MTKNLNWEILTKNLLTFKMWDGVKNEKFWFTWDGKGFTKHQCLYQELPKKEEVGQTAYTFKGEGLVKKRGLWDRGGGGWYPNPQYGLLRHQTKKLIINHTFPSLEHLFVIHKIYKRHFHLKNEKTLKVLEILVDSRYCLEINPSFFHVFLDFLKICFSSNLL